MATKIITTEVFAAAYPLTYKGPFLTHAVEVVDGHMVRVLCNRVKLKHCTDDQCCWTDEAPTCEYCARAVG